MPIIEFICVRCAAKQEKIVSIAELESIDKNPPACNNCHSKKTERVEFSQSTFKLIGKWHATTGNY